MTTRRAIGARPTARTRTHGSKLQEWEQRLTHVMPLFGHRNWIVVADSAYPAQARPSIETVVASAGQLAVVERVLRLLRAGTHVTPTIYTDRELQYVIESDAPGVSAYRRKLDHLFGGNARVELPHEELIARLDQAAELFRVLIVKTRFAVPYTSVFFQLDCAYWTADAERRLRNRMRKA